MSRPFWTYGPESGTRKPTLMGADEPPSAPGRASTGAGDRTTKGTKSTKTVRIRILNPSDTLLSLWRSPLGLRDPDRRAKALRHGCERRPRDPTDGNQQRF